MKVLVLIFIAVTAVVAEEQKTCLEEADGGMCRGYFPMYYYDPKSQSCKEFIYGGCGGNGNRYPSEEACLENCKDVVVWNSESVCALPAETGMCRGFFQRFYFDSSTGKCQKFVYGGCGGNENNFKSVDECEQRCGKKSAPTACAQDKEVGLCDAAFQRYFFNKQTGKCEQFIYGGCGGNSNNFNTQEECEDVCSGIETQKGRSEDCDLPAETGMCFAYLRRFYFNSTMEKCQRFVYGGCGGNKNNFKTLSECEKNCQKERKTCVEEPEIGMCRGYFPSYYYDAKTRSCRKFIYGGCQGNGNRYLTEEECLDNCKDVVVSGSQSVCELPAETGSCRGFFRRFYFDSTTGRCQRFVYGGCGGNENNFESINECNQRCGKKLAASACEEDVEVGSCKAAFRRYFFNKKTGKCDEFIYGGCDGNSNNFNTKEECEDVCSG